MPELLWRKKATDDFVYWTGKDAKTMRKIAKLLLEMTRTPYVGTGKPEPLKGDRNGFWSRRIDDANRIVYSVKNDVVHVESLRGHYDD